MFRFLALAGLVVSLIIFPSQAFAGLLNAFKDLFASSREEVHYVANSQTLALLEGGQDRAGSVGGGDIGVYDGALASDVNFASEIIKPKNDQIAIYEVREGDTLSEISEMFGVSIKTIMWANDLDAKTVQPGEKLVILPVSGIRHKVAKGDTISTIAKKYKGDAEEIAEFNHMDLDEPLSIGMEIIVPDGEISAGSASVAVKSSGSSSSKPSYSGYYARPISGGRRSQGIHGYNAVDLAAPAGTAVYASAGGSVIVAKAYGWNGGYGSYIVISHGNGTQTLYAHLTDVYVTQGETVSQGDTIGTVGNTGKSTGAHLHFEVRGAQNPF